MDGLQTIKNTIEDEGYVLVRSPSYPQGERSMNTICDCMGKLFNKLSFEQSILSF
jgi:hypothetical protein